MKNICIIIIALVISINLCACNSVKDEITDVEIENIGENTIQDKKDENSVANSSVDAEDENNSIKSEIAYPTFSSIEELVEELEDEIKAGNEKVYELTKQFEGYELSVVALTPHYITYYYDKPEEIILPEYPFSTEDMGVRESMREDSNVLRDAYNNCKGLFGIDINECIYIEDEVFYNPYSNVIHFAVDHCRMSIKVPDNLNNYDILKEYCHVREVTVDSLSGDSTETE